MQARWTLPVSMLSLDVRALRELFIREKLLLKSHSLRVSITIENSEHHNTFKYSGWIYNLFEGSLERIARTLERLAHVRDFPSRVTESTHSWSLIWPHGRTPCSFHQNNVWNLSPCLTPGFLYWSEHAQTVERINIYAEILLCDWIIRILSTLGSKTSGKSFFTVESAASMLLAMDMKSVWE